MIRINLAPDRKVKRSDKGQQTLLAGVLIIVGVAAAVFLLVHRDLANSVDQQEATNRDLKAQNETIKKQTRDLAKMQAAVKTAKEQEEAIERLNGARAVPAWMLWELSNIMTPGRSPSITDSMQKLLDSPAGANRRWQDGWDPKHVWITSIEEKGGRFKLDGGAQSNTDMTQLALRMQASMFFDNVIPEGGGEAKDPNGISYYKFTITGNVRY
jgi:Tfp pilus assembly protein PilN